MKTTQRILFVIAFVFLCVHSVRLTYQKWFEPRSSVLDVYDEPVEVDIREAGSLQELLERYDAAHSKVEEYEANDANPELDYNERRETEPYKSELKLRAAIEDWEAKTAQISRMRIYWLFGLAFLVLGLVSLKWVNAWVGIAALIVGFSEMIYWSSPSYFTGRSQEFERLLDNKLFLAWTSLVLLIVVGYVTATLRRREPTSP